jgi:hypothetical protein
MHKEVYIICLVFCMFSFDKNILKMYCRHHDTSPTVEYISTKNKNISYMITWLQRL